MVRIKRAYEGPNRNDGYRVLVDRLWPRGLKKEALHLDLWAKDLAPTPELRTWFGHDAGRFREFARRYHVELRAAPARRLLAELARRAARGTVTLVYGARDTEHNGAIVLRDAIEEDLRLHDGRVAQAAAGPRRPTSARRRAPRHVADAFGDTA